MNEGDFFRQGLVLASQNRLAEAAQAWRESLVRQPDHAQARGNLILALTRLGRTDEAVAAAQVGLTTNPDDPDFPGRLGQLLAGLGRLDEAAAVLRRSIALGGGKREWWVLGLVERDRCQWQAAREALSHVADDVEARFELAQLLLRHGEWATGWEMWEARLNRPQAHEDRWTIPEWTGGSLTGVDLLVYGEQGAGDTIQMLRFVPELARRGATVRLAVHDALLPLVVEFPGVTQALPLSDPRCPATHRVSIMSLPHRLPADDPWPGSVPYLAAPSRPLGGDGLKVGVVWAGSASFANAGLRHVGRRLLDAMKGVPGISLYSLQLDEPPQDPAVVDLAPLIADWGDTARILMGLDLLVTVDTGTAHLAGAMGRPVWILLHKGADWRWGTGRTTPWYPQACLFRQQTAGDWGPVLAQLASELANWAASQG